MLPQGAVDITNPILSQNSVSDVIRFINDVFFDDFYTNIQRKFTFSDRGIAKLLLFKLLFKRNTKSDELIGKLKMYYPVVMAIIEEFKARDRNEKWNQTMDVSNFSVFLQCVESEIFIDKILYPLREKGVPCFTRHDSIVVANKFADEVEAFIKTVFSEIGFKYNYKSEDKFWEVVDWIDIEDSPFMQWLTDEDILTTTYDVEGESTWPITETIYMNEHELEICKRLRNIGIQHEYFEHVDADYLEEISNLPWLNQNERNILYDDIINLRDGYNFVQYNTNQLLKSLVERIFNMDLSNSQ
jgi:hypothetical protein